jgi:hypothetical protein
MIGCWRQIERSSTLLLTPMAQRLEQMGLAGSGRAAEPNGSWSQCKRPLTNVAFVAFKG